MSLLEFSATSAKERKDAFAQARQASELMKALSHEARLLILCLLVDGEKSVSEIEEFMDMPQAAVSQHLARLRLDGLVDARRDGRNIYYSLSSDEVKAVIGTLHRLYCKPARGAVRRRA
ncbi:MAG: winged helix-turn-helix transcriptional regulator [Aestuariivirga sp.]|jgi:DNA-binding transcriptional ArsR family regulator|nr:winged helix-turn-helix transcriptional regulator [Aestuariivirga sp.]